MEHETLLQLAEQLGVTGSALMESYSQYLYTRSLYMLIAVFAALALGLISFTTFFIYSSKKKNNIEKIVVDSVLAALITIAFILSIGIGSAVLTAKILQPEGAAVSSVISSLTK